MTEPYIERVNQFVVEYREEMSDERKAAYRINGIDPDNYWNLQWSFTTVDAAEEQARYEEKRHTSFCKDHGCTPWKIYRTRDLGAPIEITRSAWF